MRWELCTVTNLAIARREDPETFARVKRVLWMGAAIDAPGNTSPNAEVRREHCHLACNPHADPSLAPLQFNLYADPVSTFAPSGTSPSWPFARSC